MALVNMMESFVNERLKEMLKSETCCKCERCVEDMIDAMRAEGLC